MEIAGQGIPPASPQAPVFFYLVTTFSRWNPSVPHQLPSLEPAPPKTKCLLQPLSRDYSFEILPCSDHYLCPLEVSDLEEDLVRVKAIC
jgi:hypothetical protein